MGFHRKFSRTLLSALSVLVLAGMMVSALPQKSHAFAICVIPAGCPVANIPTLIQDINDTLTEFHEEGRDTIMEFISLSFQAHENWLTGVFFRNYIRPTMQGMTKQLSAVSIQQVAMMGMFLDAKQQLETQRLGGFLLVRYRRPLTLRFRKPGAPARCRSGCAADEAPSAA